MSGQAPFSLPAAPPSPTGPSSLGDMVLFPSGSAHGKGFSGALPSEKEVVGPMACMDQGTSHRAIEATGQKEHARELWPKQELFSTPCLELSTGPLGCA